MRIALVCLTSHGLNVLRKVRDGLLSMGQSSPVTDHGSDEPHGNFDKRQLPIDNNVVEPSLNEIYGSFDGNRGNRPMMPGGGSDRADRESEALPHQPDPVLKVQSYLPASLTPDVNEIVFQGSLSSLIKEIFNRFDALILIMATGIAVRVIAPFLRDKRLDPAVVVVDETGKFSISLLSGHIGGANRLARAVANIIGAIPVITTATDVHGLPALDVYADDHGLVLEPWENVKKVSRAILEGLPVTIYTEVPLELGLPPNVEVINLKERSTIVTENPAGEFYVSAPEGKENAEKIPYVSLDEPLSSLSPGKGGTDEIPYLIVRQRQPRQLVVGVGCRRGVSKDQVLSAVRYAVKKVGGHLSDVVGLATVNIKQDEEGITQAAAELGVPVTYFSVDELKAMEGFFEHSEWVKEKIGVSGVCEPAALLAGGSRSLLLSKQVLNGVTVAVAEAGSG